MRSGLKIETGCQFGEAFQEYFSRVRCTSEQFAVGRTNGGESTVETQVEEFFSLGICRCSRFVLFLSRLQFDIYAERELA